MKVLTKSSMVFFAILLVVSALGFAAPQQALAAPASDTIATVYWTGHGDENVPCLGAHWVLSPAGDITIAVLSVNGQSYSMKKNGGGNSSFSVDTPGLVTSSTTASATYDSPSGTASPSLQLSHCLGKPGPSSTPAATNTPTSTVVPTNTTAPTNTATSTLPPTSTNTPVPTETNTPVPTATTEVITICWNGQTLEVPIDQLYQYPGYKLGACDGATETPTVAPSDTPTEPATSTGTTPPNTPTNEPTATGTSPAVTPTNTRPAPRPTPPCPTCGAGFPVVAPPTDFIGAWHADTCIFKWNWGFCLGNGKFYTRSEQKYELLVDASEATIQKINAKIQADNEAHGTHFPLINYKVELVNGVKLLYILPEAFTGYDGKVYYEADIPDNAMGGYTAIFDQYGRRYREVYGENSVHIWIICSRTFGPWDFGPNGLITKPTRFGGWVDWDLEQYLQSIGYTKDQAYQMTLDLYKTGTLQLPAK